MKKTFFTVSLLLAPIIVSAREYPNNPDRFPSLGLTYTGESGTGQYKTLGVSQDLSTAANTLILDTRLPLSSSFTLSLALGGTGTSVKAEPNAFFTDAKTDSSNGFFTISGRYYFNH